jgi:ribosomal protein L11 methyltransferase
MPQFQLRILGAREESERVARLIETAFEEEAVPVSWYETADGWAVDAWFMAESAEEVAERVRDSLGSDAFGLPLEIMPVDPSVDWVRVSLEGLSPVVAGRFVVHGSHDRGALPAGLIGLEIEANQAFGTGHHPTTWGCLVALTRLLARRRFRSVLDLGTGSGVLAIAVAKAARRAVVASDLDPLSVRIARENAVLNGVGALVGAVTAVGFDHAAIRTRRFDLVVANILAGPLKDLAPAMRRRTVPGARVVLSGILAAQAPSVLAAYGAQGFVRERMIAKDGWSTLVLARR